MRYFLLILVGIANISFAKADTTYVNAPSLSPMLIEYIRIAYDFGLSKDITDAKNQHPDIYIDINKWISTDEGHKLSQTDYEWDKKTKSFFNMFPKHIQSAQIASKMLKQAVILNIKLYFYLNNATIQLIDGNFNGIIFFDNTINDSNRWHKTIDDPKFRHLYENCKDDDGISWYYKVQKQIHKK
jgi:hypothetical protein